MISKFLFIDTYLFLHFKPIEQIDWSKYLKADKVFIVVTPIVLRELNKHKDTHPFKRIRERAASALKKLDTLLEASTTLHANVRFGVEVYFEVKEPLCDFAKHHLSRDCQDDHLVASIIEFRDAHPDAKVVLLANDIGLKLKARHQGIETFQLPNDLQLIEEPDPNEKRIKEIEQENRLLKSRIPKLKLSFEKDLNHTLFSLNKPVTELSGDEIENHLKRVRLKYPKRSSGGSGGVLGSIASMGLMYYSSEDISKYNAELEQFYIDYEAYLVQSSRYKNMQYRTIALFITFVNDGTCPAEDVSIFLHFPDRLKLYDKDNLSDIPSPPKPPQEPKTINEKLNSSSLNLNPIAIQPGFFNRSTPPNVSLLAIQGRDSDAVEFHVKKLKQRVSEQLDPLYVVFDSYEGASSFGIDYRINAANVPNEITGHLDVVIKKEGD
jgi:rRNA-processing protein FCF1